ncbi:MAG: hypothetical protein ACRELF_07095 [Gemmataceae bacterium]
MPSRKPDIPQAVYDVLQDLQLRLRLNLDQAAEVKIAWFQEVKEKVGPRAANLAMALLEASVSADRIQEIVVQINQQQATLMPDTQQPPEGAPPNDPGSPQPAKPLVSKSQTPMNLLTQAMKAVPSVKYALGVVGVAAAAALVVGLFADVRIAVAGVVVMFVFMTVLVVFAALSRSKSAQMQYAATFLMWAFDSLAVGWAFLLTSSVFFDYPKSASQLFGTPPRKGAPDGGGGKQP